MLKTNKTFDYIIYYVNFCDGYTREKTDKKLRDDMENSVFNFDSTLHDPIDWLTKQLNNDLPVSMHP